MKSIEKTSLESKYAFWYRISDDSIINCKHLNQDEYEDQVKKIAEFDCVFLKCKKRLKTFGQSFST
jgi:hypothetical protein